MIEFLDGNEAIVRGAIDAGCKFFAGYPITPATPILLGMMQELPKVGGFAIQAEDEIASIGFCIGASMAGKKAMTATSGPGISLYSENIGLAIMGETPLVIVDVQRQGPATGSATKDGQGDIQFIRWGTSGGYPIIAISPTTVEECYTFTIYAFNLAEIFRVPVFLVSSKELSMTRQRIDWSKVEKPEIINRKYLPENASEYKPYYFEKIDDIPLFSPFGGEHIVRYTTSTHDEYGNLLTTPEKIQIMMEHLDKKISEEKVKKFFPHAVKFDPQDGAETLVISYGITARSTIEAVELARSQGVKVSNLIINLLWPVPENEIKKATQNIRRIIFPEMNNGQYVLEIERIVDKSKIEIVRINQMDTTLINPKKILSEILK
ncbi:2-oxoacid:acceptor oxidoreductase subunit alpha [Candidatus Chrysopegis kryptomonas]|uniref:2-oxoglutarate ferredoxin oxidoreductase subunit alpha n=1 Tax=Candidatus Chryseopegocella kryptomonas TaxID=1633643 RepID=A0A0P1MWQ4_9BACT|nr:2-oxoacid:acceptor oxidoreductase subunit alpha [Candidatus Chrysopegis kryptomonas]CUT00492.1 2-oxoglutarate ferredoxin oxidoreductase subunit alpha [Candidatus Chrysopegis kryptomonas]